MEFCFPPATHFIATVDYLIDVLDYGSEDIDGMDDDADNEQGQDPHSLDVGRPLLRTTYTWLIHPKDMATTKKSRIRTNPLRRSPSAGAPNAVLSLVAQRMATLAPEKIALWATPKTMKSLSELHPNRRNTATGKTTLMTGHRR